ncbi:hypothetical protein [Spirosoma aerolatum]|uniref:hypothetical protein n=1 Tax=Spirosoma aerolatum TaxID=1211326 RepID=UPI0009AC5FF7|nr:hypothetical protein [Spirosoma aerolatum]
MNTEQNYVGKAESATTIPQMAQNEGQTLSIVDNRQSSEVNQALLDAQTTLLELVKDYTDCISPIESINELLRVWLTSTNPSVDLENPKNKRHLDLMLDLVNFLVALKEANETVLVLDQASTRIE